MGVVYQARDVTLERDVAVKTLDGTSAAGLARLKQEARTLAAVTHPAISGIHGVESWRGRPLLVVEFLPGGTLAERVRRSGRIRAAEAAGVAATIAGGLAALHDAGFLHGDVKPSNVGFAADGSAKLLDFGLARLAAGERFFAGGTVGYLSPELLAGRPAEAADDVWALAWSCTRWCRAGIRSPAPPTSRSGFGGGGSAGRVRPPRPGRRPCSRSPSRC